MKNLFSKRQIIPFVMAGYPSLLESEDLARELLDQGCHILEIGTPSSDPLADGPLLQKAALVALTQGGKLSATLALVARLKRDYPHAHFVLFTYFSLLHTPGLERSLKSCAAAGISATLIVDLPPEEASPVVKIQSGLGLGHVFLASPTTSKLRLQKINELSNFFTYYVSRNGVTGTQSQLSSTVVEELQNLRTHIHTPLAVGFGISTADQVRILSPHTQAVVIGSRWIEILDQAKTFIEGRKSSGRLFRDCTQALANP